MTFQTNGVEAGETVARLLAHEPLSRSERLHALTELLGEAACRQIGLYPLPETFKLSVVIPVYNEERWVRELVRRVQAVEIPTELVIVDDCSKDNTRAILAELEREYDNVRVFLQE